MANSMHTYCRASLILAVLSLCFFSLLSAEEVGTAKPWVVDIAEQRYVANPDLIYATSNILKIQNAVGDTNFYVSIGKDYYYIGQRVFDKATSKCVGTLNLPIKKLESLVFSNPELGLAVVAEEGNLWQIEEKTHSITLVKQLGATQKLKIDGEERTYEITEWYPIFVGEDIIVLSGELSSDDKYDNWYALFNLPIAGGKAGELEFLMHNKEWFYPMNATVPYIGLPVADGSERDAKTGWYSVTSDLKFKTMCLDLTQGGCKTELLPMPGLAWCDGAKNNLLYSYVSVNDAHRINVTANIVDAKTNEVLFIHEVAQEAELTNFGVMSSLLGHSSIYWHKLAFLNASCSGQGVFQVWGNCNGQEKWDKMPQTEMETEVVSGFFSYLHQYIIKNGKVQIRSNTLKNNCDVVAAWKDLAITKQGKVFLPCSFNAAKEKEQEKVRRRILDKVNRLCIASSDYYYVVPAFPIDNYFICFDNGVVGYYHGELQKPQGFYHLDVVGFSEVKYLWKRQRLAFRRKAKSGSKQRWEYYIYCSNKQMGGKDEWQPGTYELDKEFEEYTFRGNVPLDALELLPACENPIEVLGFSKNKLFYIVKDPVGKELLYVCDNKSNKLICETEGRIIGTVGIDNEYVIEMNKKSKVYFLTKGEKSEKLYLNAGFYCITHAFDGDIIVERYNPTRYDLIDTRGAKVYYDKCIPNYNEDKSWWYAITPVFMALDGFGMSRSITNSCWSYEVYLLEERQLESEEKYHNWMYDLEEKCRLLR